MDSPWNDDYDHNAIKEAEWTKMSSEFTNVREITQLPLM